MSGSTRVVPQPGEVWRHYKGGLYTVVVVALDEADPAHRLVVYRGEDGRTWVRSLDRHDRWDGLAPHPEYGHKSPVRRFVRVDPDPPTVTTTDYAPPPAWVAAPRPRLRGDGIPTRADLSLASPAEVAIRAAMYAVEIAGASTALTDAVVLLGKALDRVADHVEGQP